ncbi:hypothetical protein FOZ62_024749, partial [Perkinsus olseni]
TLRHIQTLQLDDAVSPISQFAQLSSIIVDSGGSELLATTDEATFITMELERTSRGRFDVSEATVYPMRDPQGEIMIFKDDFLGPRRRDRRDHLLMLCGSSTSDDRNVYTAYAYDESIPNRFFVESRDSFNPADMAGLRNGDFMILFSREDTRR